MCRLSWNLGALTSWNPQGLSRPVMGLLYLYLLYPCYWKLIGNPYGFYMLYKYTQTDRQTDSCWDHNCYSVHHFNIINGAFYLQNLFTCFIKGRSNIHPSLPIEQAGWRYHLYNLMCADLQNGPRHRLPDICGGYGQLLQVTAVRPGSYTSTHIASPVLAL
jgi:hypothetical protein